VRPIIILLTVLFIATAVAVEPGFDPKEVVRQIRPVNSTTGHLELSGPGVDDGEFLVDTCPVYNRAPGAQDIPAIAFDGENLLVVWQDTRSAYWSDIHGARVTPDGTLLDPTGFLVASADREQEWPAVAFGGTQFLVAWQDRRNGFYRDVYATRVTLDGVVLDTAGIEVSTAADDQFLPAVAFDGENFLVAWGDERTGSSDVVGTRIAPDGTVLDTSGVAISSAIGGQSSPALAFDGENYLAVWDDTRSGTDADIYGSRVTPALAVLDPEGIPVCTTDHGQIDPAISYGDTEYVVVWHDWGVSEIQAARVTLDGGVLDPQCIVVSTGAGLRGLPSVAFDGENFLSVWKDGRGTTQVYGARISPDGVVLDTAGIQVPGTRLLLGRPVVAFGGGNHFVVWPYSTTNREVCATRIAPDGTVLDSTAIILSTATNSQVLPAVAAGSIDFLVAWEDGCDYPSGGVYAKRISSQGALLDTLSIAVTVGDNRQGAPTAAFDGTNYLVVWQDAGSGHYDIHGARITQTGVLLDPQGFIISAATGSQENPAVASNGDNCLVVWQDKRNGFDPEVYGARVTPEAIVLDPDGIEVCGVASYQPEPAAAFDGVNWLVVWAHGDYDGDIHGARVTPAGTVLDTAGILVSGAEYGQSAPAVASDGFCSFVVWQDERSGWRPDIYGARVSQSGTVIDTLGIELVADTVPRCTPVVSFDGVFYHVFWQRMSGYPDSDISGARVTAGGAVLDSFTVVVQEGSQRNAAATVGNAGQMLLVYEGWAGQVGGKAYDTYRTWAKLGPFTAIEQNGEREVRCANWPTVVRGVLRFQPRAGSSQLPAMLVDITGRRVMDLAPGPNDIRLLAPGVYFVRTAESGGWSAVRKIVIQR
jgi:hypothetical protein